MLKEQNPTQLIESIMGKQLHLQIQAQRDPRTGTTRAMVNNAAFLEPESENSAASSIDTTAIPKTPAKRSSFHAEGASKQKSKKTKQGLLIKRERIDRATQKREGLTGGSPPSSSTPP